jgi:hypothetical protein
LDLDGISKNDEFRKKSPAHLPQKVAPLGFTALIPNSAMKNNSMRTAFQPSYKIF